MELLQPGTNNLTAAASYTGGGGGGGGVPASSPENIIQMAAELKTDRARPGHRENKTSARDHSCSSSILELIT
jgi:hypothetical protein